MECPYCDAEAIWTENKIIYGKNYGKSYMCYYCEECGAYVGCHQNTKKPLGTMANAELREWRKKTHAKIDHLWRDGMWHRRTVYDRLRKFYNKQIHIGEADIAMCQSIINNYQDIFFKKQYGHPKQTVNQVPPTKQRIQREDERARSYQTQQGYSSNGSTSRIKIDQRG